MVPIQHATYHFVFDFVIFFLILRDYKKGITIMLDKSYGVFLRSL